MTDFYLDKNGSNTPPYSSAATAGTDMSGVINYIVTNTTEADVLIVNDTSTYTSSYTGVSSANNLEIKNNPASGIPKLASIMFDNDSPNTGEVYIHDVDFDTGKNLYINNVASGTIENVLIENVTGDGITLLGSGNVGATIDHVTVDTCSGAGVVASGVNGTVTNSIITNNDIGIRSVEVPTDSLVYRWKMDEGSGATITDTVEGKVLTLDAAGSTTWHSSGGPGDMPYFDFNGDRARKFRLTSGILDNYEGRSPITVSMWINLNSTTNAQYFFTHRMRGSDADMALYFYFVTGGIPRVLWHHGVTSNWFGGTTFVIGEWTHFVVVFDQNPEPTNDKVIMHVNGNKTTENCTKNYPSFIPRTSYTGQTQGRFTIGTFDELTSSGPVAAFCDVQIHNKALSDQEIEDIRQATLNGWA